MAEHTHIIDLYGIPACGKTTLAEYMAKHPKNGLKVATMRDCMRSALNNKWKLARSISLKNFWASVRLKFSAPIDKKRSAISFKSVLFVGAFKNYVRKYTDYDIVVTDHGDIQSFVSLERGDDLHKLGKFKKACLQYLEASLSTAFVYCQIDAGTALQRMNNRSRDRGRIDSISDQNLKLQELNKEISCFDFWTAMLKERSVTLLEVDAKEPSSKIAENLFLLLQK